jgi:hypothetical protein
LLAKNTELEEQLKVIALWRYDGQNESADALADKLDLKLLPAAERAASAFRRLKAETDITQNQSDFDYWRNSAEGMKATAEQAIAVAKALNAVPANVDRFTAALDKIRNPDTGFAKLNKDLDEFIEKMKLTPEEVRRLKKELNITDEKNMWEDLSVSIASNMGNAVNQLIDSFGKAEVSFGDMAAAMLKDIAKLIVQLLIMKPLLDSIKGYFGVSANAIGNAYPGKIGWPQGVYDTPHYFPMPEGMKPLSRFASGGVFAEAGAEAIMPLKRTRSGNLGVEATGGGLQVNIQNNFAQEVEVTAAKNQQADGQVVLDVMVERKVRQMVANGSLDNQFRGAYGLTRQPA